MLGQSFASNYSYPYEYQDPNQDYQDPNLAYQYAPDNAVWYPDGYQHWHQNYLKKNHLNTIANRQLPIDRQLPFGLPLGLFSLVASVAGVRETFDLTLHCKSQWVTKVE